MCRVRAVGSEGGPHRIDGPPAPGLQGGPARCRCLARGNDCVAPSALAGLHLRASWPSSPTGKVNSAVTRTTRKIVPMLLCGFVPTAMAGCSLFAQSRTFAELAADAAAVPVPMGVTFVREGRSVEDGPGFTTATYKEVSRQYVSEMSCQVLEHTWSVVLRRAHREFRIDNVPHKFGSIGSLGIVITDRPEDLGIAIGTDHGACGKPFVYSFNSPH